jgi:CHAT domain
MSRLDRVKKVETFDSPKAGLPALDPDVQKVLSGVLISLRGAQLDAANWQEVHDLLDALRRELSVQAGRRARSLITKLAMKATRRSTPDHLTDDGAEPAPPSVLNQLDYLARLLGPDLGQAGLPGTRAFERPGQLASSPDPRATAPVSAPEPARYLVGDLPTQIQIGADLSLIVSITTQSPDPGKAAAPLPGLSPGPQGVPVTLVVQRYAGLLALDEVQRTVTVPQHGDPAPVRFPFRAYAVGLARIQVTAWLGGTFLAELRLEVSVGPDKPKTREGQKKSAAIGVLQADPGEATLQVNYDGQRYSFQLLSQRYMFSPVLAESLTEAPGQAVERTVAMLRKLAAGTSGYERQLAGRWVRETGTGLWQDLVPTPVREQFWQVYDSITAFNIACADDTVPWELLHPLTPTGEDAGFLVEQFPVLRRVYDQGRSDRVLLGDAHYVVPPDSPGNAQAEVAAIGRILRQPAGPAISHLSDLLDLIDRGGTGLLHFACHNSFSLESGGSSIKMTGGRFVPQLLNTAVGRRRLAASSPLIFVNACRTAGLSAEYTKMMGWASQFMAAGAGAFIGTLWPVSSEQATLFAKAFYTALSGGANLGEASLAARRAIKDDADPTWLAYATYGNPVARGTPQV